ncbi:NAD(P)/FAD-dependent oxidoreductase [Methylibium sp. Pch-M]|uniref:flavin-containing monooxygenase n=1 Tax=Methylibium TaxID=316612 RepID=UPI0003F3DB71|nr:MULTISPECIES: NAD(P)/FAD-dependent oxidoreductase [Methylibium]EWS54695.1 Phenylacetone monooxygenase [Methylibium sp. T29]EWS59144.1 Phenylacetone monooxygenase [Methylibium sp. T29-B]MBN9206719.1 NAD(P)/FAD-dependent oxidoreductase [Methylibium petroleiphilum]QAZ40389.1 NAD(P)/FAD-dependent oxidoreductase [Methylibium sp. Pch-M]
MSNVQQAPKQVDAVVVGAGFAGMYSLYKLREQGLKVQVYEAGTGVGGTWYWNRYPGARVDSQAYIYQYWFSKELLDEWNWSERFPAQDETERYLNHVADRFDLRKDIQFKTRVTAAAYDEASQRWTITTDDGQSVSAQYFIMGTGGLSVPMLPALPGIENFKGRIVHTAQWPREGVDLKGKRVGIIGTGATGIQVIQTIAGEVGHLTVFQRTPNYTIPMRNPKYDDAARAELRAQYPMLKERVQRTFAGFDYDFEDRNFFDVDPAERQRILQRLWDDGSLNFWIGGFREVFFDEKVNAEFSDFVRQRIRERVKDPKVADKLVPQDYGFGTRRVPLETKYYEAFNRDNVLLVDTKATPMEEVTATGIRTAAGLHELDILICATGFDAGTGALTKVDIRGRDGVLLRDAWAQDGVRTTMGLQVHGYPNLFMTMAPFSPAAAFCNVPTCLQQQVDWIADCIAFVRQQGRHSIEPSAEAEAKWVAHHDELANLTLVPKTNSWYMGSNVKGKPRRLLAYAGGVGTYRAKCEEVKASGYEGFVTA